MTTDRRRFLVLVAALFLRTPALAATSSFHAIYDDPRLRDRFFLFLQNIFHLYPEDRFHQLIIEATAAHHDDRAIYEAVLAGLPGIKAAAGDLTYALPALKKQKKEMAKQAATLLDGVGEVDGYLEIGTTGRYVAPLAKQVKLRGPTFLVNDARPGYGPVDMLERGGIGQVGQFIPLGSYDPIPGDAVPDASLDLVSSFIGFHHCPADRLDGFVASVHRVLRPGAHLLLREHDVVDSTMDTLVALAHDVFNAGVGVDWATNAEQIRGFRSAEAWSRLLADRGFEPVPARQVQAHDPTDNTLLHFRRA